MNKKLVKDLLEIAKDLDSEQENFFESGNENLNKLWEIIERQLGCHEANLSLFNGRSEKERAKDFECAAYKSNNCKNPKDNVYIIKLQVVDHEHTLDEHICECCFQTS